MSRLQFTITGAALLAAPLSPALAHHEAAGTITGGPLFFAGVGLACVLWFLLRRVWS